MAFKPSTVLFAYFLRALCSPCVAEPHTCASSDATSMLQLSTPISDLASALNDMRNLYLNNVRDTLTGAILKTPGISPHNNKQVPFDKVKRWKGDSWCDYCFTMAGGARVQNVRDLVETTIAKRIPGDFLEAGTWRGGCSIMARVVQKAFGEGAARKTYLCDSFSGLPLSSQKKDQDFWSESHFLEVSQDEVEDNVKQFVELDDNVQFRKGYFYESLPKVRKELQAQGRQLAVVRGDGDMYESFMDILYNLYDFIPVGGYFICDDCPYINAAQEAIDDFRALHGITEEVMPTPSNMGTFWRKEKPIVVNYTYYLEWNATRTFKKKD